MRQRRAVPAARYEPIATPSAIGRKRLRRTARGATSLGTSSTAPPAAAERAPVGGAAPPGGGPPRAQRLPRAEPARMPDDLGAGVGRSGAARIARAVVDDEHGRVPLRARGDARHGRLLVEHRDDDERCHRPMISATSLPPRPTPWTRLGRPLTRAALAAATPPSTPPPASP